MNGHRVKALRRQLLDDLRRALGREPRFMELPTAADLRRLKRAWRRRGQSVTYPVSATWHDRRWTANRRRRLQTLADDRRPRPMTTT